MDIFKLIFVPLNLSAVPTAIFVSGCRKKKRIVNYGRIASSKVSGEDTKAKNQTYYRVIASKKYCQVVDNNVHFILKLIDLAARANSGEYIKIAVSFYLAVMAIAAVILFQSCTLIGRGIGAAIDGGQHEQGYLEIGGLDSGSVKEFIPRNGEPPFQGVYLGLDTLDTEDYQLLYSKISDSIKNQLNLPQIGDTLVGPDTMILTDFGYEFRQAKYRPYEFVESQYLYFRATSRRDMEARKIYLGDFSELNISNGNKYGQKYMIDLAYNGKLPLKNMVMLETDLKRYSVELNSIYAMRNVQTHKARKIGTSIGAILDVTWLVLLIISAIAMSNTNYIGGFNWE